MIWFNLEVLTRGIVLKDATIFSRRKSLHISITQPKFLGLNHRLFSARSTKASCFTLASMAAQLAGGEAETIPSDLARLWKEAVEDYEKTTGQNFQPGKLESIDDVVDAARKTSMKFKNLRNDRSKVSKLQTALENNLNLIQKIVMAVQNVANAASSVGISIAKLEIIADNFKAWTPALPASLIFTAFGQVVQVRYSERSNMTWRE